MTDGRRRIPPPRRGDPAYVRNNLTYWGCLLAVWGLIVVGTLAAGRHLWIFLGAAAVLGVLACLTAWRALMRLPKRGP
jgi:hypothetical protein